MIAFFRAVRSFWRARQRDIDLQILWPICKREAAAKFSDDSALGWAKTAFAMHACADDAWRELGEDKLIAFIETLE
jgi:hypothetical protein